MADSEVIEERLKQLRIEAAMKMSDEQKIRIFIFVG